MQFQCSVSAICCFLLSLLIVSTGSPLQSHHQPSSARFARFMSSYLHGGPIPMARKGGESETGGHVIKDGASDDDSNNINNINNNNNNVDFEDPDVMDFHDNQKRQAYDDYGHLRFGKREFDDYGHMRFGKRNYDDYGYPRYGRSNQ